MVCLVRIDAGSSRGGPAIRADSPPTSRCASVTSVEQTQRMARCFQARLAPDDGEAPQQAVAALRDGGLLPMSAPLQRHAIDCRGEYHSRGHVVARRGQLGRQESVDLGRTAIGMGNAQRESAALEWTADLERTERASVHDRHVTGLTQSTRIAFEGDETIMNKIAITKTKLSNAGLSAVGRRPAITKTRLSNAGLSAVG